MLCGPPTVTGWESMQFIRLQIKKSYHELHRVVKVQGDELDTPSNKYRGSYSGDMILDACLLFDKKKESRSFVHNNLIM